MKTKLLLITLMLCLNVSAQNLDNCVPTSSIKEITECGSYSWNGNTYTQSGTYTWSGINAGGCDSTATLNLTIFEKTTSTIEVNACGPYEWNGVVYSKSGAYTSLNSCASQTLLLHINEITEVNAQIFSSDTYLFNGTVYTETGVYYDTIPRVANCDSIVRLNLYVNSCEIIASEDSLCSFETVNLSVGNDLMVYTLRPNNIESSYGNYYYQGQYSEFRGRVNSSNPYYFELRTGILIDSKSMPDFNNFILISDPTSSYSYNDGSGLEFITYFYNINTLNIDSTYYYRAFIILGNDTILAPNQHTFFVRNETFNPMLDYGVLIDIDENRYKTINIGSQTWMAQNLMTNHYANGDSLENEMSLYFPRGGNGQYNHPEIYDQRNICPVGTHVPNDSDWFKLFNYTFNNEPYAYECYYDPLSDSAYYFGLQNYSGFPQGAGPLQSNNKESWNWGYRTNSSGFSSIAEDPYNNNYWSSSIVDSVTFGNLNPNEPPYIFPLFNQVLFYPTGIQLGCSYNYYYPEPFNEIRCISNEEITEDKFPIIEGTQSISVSSNTASFHVDIANDNNAELSEKGMIISTFTSITGLTIGILPDKDDTPFPLVDDYKILQFGSNPSDFNVDINNLMPNGKYYVRAYVKNKYGIRYGEELTISTQGNSFLWSTGEASQSINVYPTQTTTYSVTINQGEQSCTSDKIIAVNQPTVLNETMSACGSYTWRGNTYTQSGTYTWTGTNAGGCILTATLNLTIFEKTTSSIEVNTCGPYEWNGVVYSKSGAYTYLNSCASQTLLLHINEIIEVNAQINSGETYDFNGIGFSETGVYYDTIPRLANCDSIVRLNLYVNPTTCEIIASDDSLCSGEVINLSVENDLMVYTLRPNNIESSYFSNYYQSQYSEFRGRVNSSNPYYLELSTGILIDSKSMPDFNNFILISDPTIGGGYYDGSSLEFNAYFFNINTLNIDSTYYYRAFIISGNDTILAPNQHTFFVRNETINPMLDYGDLMDIDENRYKTINIGSQTWMAENLMTNHYSNGESLENEMSLYFTGGGNGQYNHTEIYDQRNICPLGTHVPNDSDWVKLFKYTFNNEPYAYECYYDPLSDSAYYFGLQNYSGFPQGAGPLQSNNKESWNWGYRTNSSGFSSIAEDPYNNNYWSSSIVDSVTFGNLNPNEPPDIFPLFNQVLFSPGGIQLGCSYNYYWPPFNEIRCISNEEITEDKFPIIEGTQSISVSSNTASFHVDIENGNNAELSEKGMIISTFTSITGLTIGILPDKDDTPFPLVDDYKILQFGSNPSDFNVDINNLMPSGKYYVRAYVKNKYGIRYGEELTITTQGNYSFLWSTGEAYQSINVYPTETTTYSVTINQGEQSCTSDKIITVNQSTAFTETLSACNSYNWNNTTYTQSGTYTWTGTNAAGCDSVVTLNLTITPLLNFGTLASGNQTFTGSGNPSVISFSNNPVGGSGTFTYQWYSKSGIQAAPIGTATTGWSLITGATSASYDPPVRSASISYAVQVNPTGIPDCGVATWATGVRQITINPAVFTPGVLATGNQTLCNLADPANIAFSTAATTGSTFLWYYQDGIIAAPAATAALTGWTSTATATSSYNPPAGLTLNRTYACRVTNGANSQWASGVRQITVLPVVNFGTLAAGNQSFTGSGDPANVAIATAPTGGAGTYSYQWYSQAGIIASPTGTATTGWTLITGATSASYNPPVQSASISYAVQVNPTGTPDCGVATWATGVRQITINPAVFTPGVLATGNQTLCNPADPSSITFSTVATAASTFQWYYQDGIIAAPIATAALTGWTSISGATASTFDAPSGLTANRTYACRVTNGANSQWASGVRQITVLPVVNFGTLAAGNQSFTGSGDPANVAFATAPTGGAGTYSYQWYSQAGIIASPTGTATTGWTLLTGATSASYDPGVQTASISFAVQVKPSGTPDCGVATWATGVRQITINPVVFTPGVLATGNQTLCNPADPANIAFSTAATTGSTFQWYFQNGIIAAPVATAALTGWTSISGATASTYDAPSGLTASRTYACRVTNGANSQWASGVRQITVLPVFNPGTITSGDENFCSTGNPANITLSANPTGSGAYQWRWYFRETTTGDCPTGSAIPSGWNTNSTSTNIIGTTLDGSGISFDPTSAGALNSGRTFAVLITPIENGGIPACGAPQWAASCRKTFVTTCTGFTPGVLAVGNQTLCNPADPSSITFSTVATTGATFQWYYQDGIIAAPVATAALTGWTSISGATASSYDAPSGLTASRTYACRVTSGANSQWASGVRQIIVLPVVNFGTLAAGNQSFTGSGDPANIAFATSPTGGAGAYSYQWYSQAGIIASPTGTASTGWTLITGATAASYDPGVQTASISFAVQVKPSGTPDCGVATWATGVRQITITPAVFTPGVLATGNQTLCNPADPSSITFSTVATTGATFQWYYQDGIIAAPVATAALTGWTSISGATASFYDAPSGLTASRTYACRVTSGANSQWASGVRQITVLPMFNPGSLIANQTGCNTYDPVSITMATNPVGSGAYNWKWYYWENATQVCPTGSTVPAGAVTSSTDVRFFGTSTTGSGIFFDPSSSGTNGRTWALLITPAANGAIPACGVAQFSTTCHKTIRQVCRFGQEEESADQEFTGTAFLGQSYPNPNNGKFNIEYFLPTACKGAIVIYDITGKKLAQSECKTGGRETLEFDVQHLSQGTYYYSLECNGLKMETRKMILVK